MKKKGFLNFFLALVLMLPCMLLVACGYSPEDTYAIHYYFNDETAEVKATYTEDFWKQYNFKKEDRPHNLFLSTIDAQKAAPTPKDIIGPTFKEVDADGNTIMVKKVFGGWYFDKECTASKIATKESWAKLNNEQKEAVNFYAKWLNKNEVNFVFHANDNAKYPKADLNAKFTDALKTTYGYDTPVITLTVETLNELKDKAVKETDIEKNEKYYLDGWYTDEGEFLHKAEYKLDLDNVANLTTLVNNIITSGINHIDVYPNYKLIPKIYFNVRSDIYEYTHLHDGVDVVINGVPQKRSFVVNLNPNYQTTLEKLSNDILKTEILSHNKSQANADYIFNLIPTISTQQDLDDLFLPIDISDEYYGKKVTFKGWYIIEYQPAQMGERANPKPIEELKEATKENIMQKLNNFTYENGLDEYLDIGAYWEITDWQ